MNLLEINISDGGIKNSMNLFLFIIHQENKMCDRYNHYYNYVTYIEYSMRTFVLFILCLCNEYISYV